MRGLKQKKYPPKHFQRSRIFYRCVDWNRRNTHQSISNEVASFTDAWIETEEIPTKAFPTKSHLLQMRGLKPFKRVCFRQRNSRIFYRCVDWNFLKEVTDVITQVASFTDAWIETCIPSKARAPAWSHLLQMRGLKLVFPLKRVLLLGRIFYRCVDWNCLHSCSKGWNLVASFTDAWIETPWCCCL